MTDHARHVESFHALHAAPGLLVLANAWDAGSARLFESVGAPAIATTSAGVAWSHGCSDGDALPVALHLATLAAIVRRVQVPVSADIEGGYSDDPAAVGDLAQRIAALGVVGINIEDGAGAPELLAAKIAAIRAAAGDALFVNARCDVWLRGLAPDRPMDEFLARAARYRDAGASGIFAPGISDPAAIAAAVAGIGGLPLNVLARPGVPDADELRRLGVRRLSAGSAITQAVYGAAAGLARDFGGGDAAGLWRGGLDYAAINALMG